MLRLALHSPRFGGKSTLARELEARGFQHLNYTDFIKQKLCEALAAVGVYVTVEEMHENKEFFRPLIIEFASVIGCNMGYGVDEMIASIRPDATGVVFDNVRFPAQWEKLERAGFTLLRLTTPERIRLARARGVGVHRESFEKLAELATERPLPTVPGEIRLSVNGNMQRVIDELTGHIIKQAVA